MSSKLVESGEQIKMEKHPDFSFLELYVLGYVNIRIRPNL